MNRLEGWRRAWLYGRVSNCDGANGVIAVPTVLENGPDAQGGGHCSVQLSLPLCNVLALLRTPAGLCAAAAGYDELASKFNGSRGNIQPESSSSNHVDVVFGREEAFHVAVDSHGNMEMIVEFTR